MNTTYTPEEIAEFITALMTRIATLEQRISNHTGGQATIQGPQHPDNRMNQMEWGNAIGRLDKRGIQLKRDQLLNSSVDHGIWFVEEFSEDPAAQDPVVYIADSKGGFSNINWILKWISGSYYATLEFSQPDADTRNESNIYLRAKNDAEPEVTLGIINSDNNGSTQRRRLVSINGFFQSSSTELTIASGSITPINMYHSVDTESDAASDDLDTITATGGADIEGCILILKSANSARDVVIKHGTGNIILNGAADRTLGTINDRIMLQYDGTNWVELSFQAA